MEENYRTPTDAERAFLRVITRCYPELAEQIESCEITDYDPTGYIEVRVLGGPRCPVTVKEPIDGPALDAGDNGVPAIDILLWLTDERMLKTIEVIEWGSGTLDNLYGKFANAEGTDKLLYRSLIAQPPRDA
jgi:hypothetical protein